MIVGVLFPEFLINYNYMRNTKLAVIIIIRCQLMCCKNRRLCSLRCIVTQMWMSVTWIMETAVNMQTAPTRQETLLVPVLKDISVTGSPAQVASAICVVHNIYKVDLLLKFKRQWRYWLAYLKQSSRRCVADNCIMFQNERCGAGRRVNASNKIKHCHGYNSTMLTDIL